MKKNTFKITAAEKKLVLKRRKKHIAAGGSDPLFDDAVLKIVKALKEYDIKSFKAKKEAKPKQALVQEALKRLGIK